MKQKNYEKLKTYFETKDEKIREEIVNDNANLVVAVASDYGKKIGINKRELMSYGYEGLLHAIDNYNPNTSYNFSSYAYDYIRGYILGGIPELQGTKFNEFYRNFIKYKTQVENEKMIRIKEDINVVDDILNKMIEDNLITRKHYFYFREQILLINLLFFDDMEEEIVSEKSAYDSLNDDYVANLISEYLSILSEKQKLVLEYRFGLNGKPRKTLKEIAEMIGYTHEGVRQLEKRAITLIRRYNAVHRIESVENIEDKTNGIKGRKMG